MEKARKYLHDTIERAGEKELRMMVIFAGRLMT